jgi:protoporphyrinogen oxidase
MTDARLLILGGGISGLAAARALEESGANYLLIERCPSLGGLTRTAKVADYCFDYTGHFLHLRRYASPADIPLAGLRDDDWTRVERRSACYVAGKMVTAPIQYHLGELPPEWLKLCVESYNQRPRTADSPATFREYLVSNFGRALADLFLIPQNEKTFATSLNRLSLDAVKRFFPVADDAAIRRGIEGGAPTAGGYNSSFWYPRQGGIEILVNGFASGTRRVALNTDIAAIDLNGHKLRTKDGREFTWDALLTSIPLPAFCRLTQEPDLIRAANMLTHSSTVSVNIGLDGEVPAALSGLHWVYVPDRKIPFYRVGMYSNICEGVCSPGKTALYAEVGLSSEQARSLDLRVVQTTVIEGLERLGWLRISSIECVVTHVLTCAYVHHTSDALRLVPLITSRLLEANVHPIGRYGRWDYTSMEDSIYDGHSTAARVIS